MITYNITLNMDKPTNITNIIVKQKDDKSRRLIFNILSNGKRMMDFESACIKANKPDGKVVYDEVSMEETMHYDLIEQFTSTAGEVECELELYGKNGQKISTPSFYLTVQRNVYDTDNFVSENVLSGLQAYVTSAHEALRQAQEIALKFEMSHGTLEEVLEEMEGTKETYVTYIEKLQEKVNEGYFNGERGPKGEDGANAVITEGSGIMGFQIVDGKLLCYYYNEIPPLEINEKGHLIYRKE